MAIRYRADPPDARSGRTIGGMTILYHRPSGQTHMLTDPGPTLIALLAEEALEPCEVAARLGLAGDAAAERLVAERLEELAAAGLLRNA